MDSIQIEELAGQWLARRDSSAWNAQDEAELRAWLDESTAHMVAFVRLEAAWKQAQRLKALGAGVPPGVVPSPQEWQLRRFFENHDAAEVSESASGSRVASDIHARHRGVLRALAASLLLALLGAIAWYGWPMRPHYQTPVGGLASVPMSDGSKITLNTDTEIQVSVTEKERRVELRQGEAFFEVAKDPARPFIVAAGSRRVIAVGTAFSVRRSGDEVRVAITEGRVRFEDGAQQPGPAGAEKQLSELAAGSVARATQAGVLIRETPIAEIENDLSWRTGYLMFRNLALADAVAEFNRYNVTKIVIQDPAVASIRVSGKFRSTQFEAFVRLLEEGFPVHAQSAGDEIVLTSK